MPDAQVDATGMWTGSSLGFSWHCECGWVSDRFPTTEEAVEAEVWPHLVAYHPPSPSAASTSPKEDGE